MIIISNKIVPTVLKSSLDSPSSASVRRVAIPHHGILWNRYKEIQFMLKISHLWLFLVCPLPPTTSFMVFSHDFVFGYGSLGILPLLFLWLESVASSSFQVKTPVSGCRDLLDYCPLTDCMPVCLSAYECLCCQLAVSSSSGKDSLSV